MKPQTDSAAQPAASAASAAEAEAPSGKDAAYENFPVGSWLLPARLRGHIHVFYAFARAIDDIADAPDLSAGEKTARLEGFARAVNGEDARDARDAGYPFAKGAAMRASLAATGVTARHCLDLISAFKQDAVKSRYHDWDDLMDYCIRSAAPVGRYLIDLHGCGARAYRHSDALCNALQVINHMQDCADDFRALNRVYLPGDWMAAAGLKPEDLAAHTAPPALREVLDRCIAACRTLMTAARPLAPALSCRRLAMESAVIIRIADALLNKLSRRDPLAARVKLNPAQYALCAVRGAAAGALGRP